MASEAERVDYDVLLAAFRMACRALIPRLDGLRELFEDIAVHGETEAGRFLAASILAEVDLQEAGE